MSADFDGETYDADRDKKRLTSELERVRRLMEDGVWRSLSEISLRTGAPEASVSARLRDLRKPKFGARIVQRMYAGEGRWVYRLEPELSHARGYFELLEDARGDMTYE